ncbi:hypothetical protein [Streptomyces profundus]|uniref:hypothetical protein n=1 Tax=Streptomyces profundus TaxID=2867410 RepID=UPI001D162DD7|nr:hypothetical protein [Streptomyces sp. MA3_2.13]UED87837.1 hypothetical protein K4G22_29565 [Streptomyces sp. MA3_2.13]
MLIRSATESPRLSRWQRVRAYAVPPTMIETATARRQAGDWAGSCAAARFDVDLDLRSLARAHGRELAALVRDDLRRLAPDLLRWHMPRVAPDGLLRPGLTFALARYPGTGRDGRPLCLVAGTPPAWAAAGQRISLALLDGTHPGAHPRRRFRLDLHRHLWDAHRADELRVRSWADRRAVDHWAAEAALLLRAEGRTTGAVTVRLTGRHRLLLTLPGADDGTGTPAARIERAPGTGDLAALPVLPEAATWPLPDLELLAAGLIDADRLHPLVASALAGASAPQPAAPPPADPGPLWVDCRGARHRIGLVDGELAALDHDPAELAREELLAALTGTPLPCLRAIDTAHRRPEALADIGERLDHGDTAGARAVVEALLGPAATLPDGPLRDALARDQRLRIARGLFRAGLGEPGPARVGAPPARRRRSPDHRSHPRHASAR